MTCGRLLDCCAVNESRIWMSNSYNWVGSDPTECREEECLAFKTLCRAALIYTWGDVIPYEVVCGVLLLPGNQPQLGAQREQKERDWDTQDCNSIFLYCNPSASSVCYGLTLLASEQTLPFPLECWILWPLLQQDLTGTWNHKWSTQMRELFLISCNWIWEGLHQWSERMNHSEQLIFLLSWLRYQNLPHLF